MLDSRFPDDSFRYRQLSVAYADAKAWAGGDVSLIDIVPPTPAPEL